MTIGEFFILTSTSLWGHNKDNFFCHTKMSVLPIVVLTIPVTRKIGPYFDSKIPYSDSDPNVEMVVSQEKQEATFNRLVEVCLVNMKR